MCPVPSAFHGLPSPTAPCMHTGPEFSVGQDPEYSRTKPTALLNKNQFSSHSIHMCGCVCLHTHTHADQSYYKSQYCKRRLSASIWTKAVFCLFIENILNPHHLCSDPHDVASLETAIPRLFIKTSLVSVIL